MRAEGCLHAAHEAEADGQRPWSSAYLQNPTGGALKVQNPFADFQEVGFCLY